MLNKIGQLAGGLPLSRKLGLIILLLVAPMLILGAMFIASQSVQGEATTRQLAGLGYLRPLMQLQVRLAAHRSAAPSPCSASGRASPLSPWGHYSSWAHISYADLRSSPASSKPRRSTRHRPARDR